MQNRRLYILMGGSGTGKTTLGNYLKELGVPEIISHTTRDMRKGEIHGITYYFIDRNEFDSIEKVEWTEYPKGSGKMYCISKEEVEGKLAQHGKLFAITDAFGVEQLKAQYPNEVEVIYLYITLEEMEKRMRERGDNEKGIQERLVQAKETGELNNHDYANHFIENVDLEGSKRKIREIVLSI